MTRKDVKRITFKKMQRDPAFQKLGNGHHKHGVEAGETLVTRNGHGER